MHPQDWLLLIGLSVLWGGTFFFVGVAVHELPPLTLVLLRVTIAAALLLPVLKLFGMPLPRSAKGWIPFAGMSVLNNIIPFSLIFTGQTMVSSGLASVLNATTPLFTVIILAATGDERLETRRVLGVILGMIGVIVLSDAAILDTSVQGLGIVLCLGGALSYGFAGLWGRRMLVGIPPLVSAAGQLICSAFAMTIIAGAVDRPWTLAMPGAATWLSVLALASLSTSLGYIVFFRIMARSGPTNVALVTVLIPVTAILLGVLILNEPFTLREGIGALVIGSALVVIDGRIVVWPARFLAKRQP
jgi:drug/metabolite transporter (DMT)-like permease